MTDDWRGSYRGKTGRAGLSQARQFMTLSGLSPSRIAALRKIHSMTSSASAPENLAIWSAVI
jgi:homoserine acetyltransferase